MLDEMAKEGLKKALDAVKSGKMKPGDSMIMKGKPKVIEEEPMDSSEGGDAEVGGLSEIAGDLVGALNAKDVGAVKDLLMEFVERCMSENK